LGDGCLTKLLYLLIYFIQHAIDVIDAIFLLTMPFS